MNIVPPPVWPRDSARPSDDLETLLRRFFRAETPNPWPALKVPARPRPPFPRRRPWWGSRFALAATVTLCLAGSAMLATLFPRAIPSSVEPTGKDTIGGSLDLPGKRGPVAPEPFTAKTPSGHTVKGWEESKGKTTIIKMEWVDPPPDGE